MSDGRTDPFSFDVDTYLRMAAYARRAFPRHGEDALQDAIAHLVGSAQLDRATPEFLAASIRTNAGRQAGRDRTRERRELAAGSERDDVHAFGGGSDVDRRMVLDRVRAVLDDLDNDEHRKILQHYFLGGLGGDEIARRLGLRRDRVYTVLSRGRDRLREPLADLEHARREEGAFVGSYDSRQLGAWRVDRSESRTRVAVTAQRLTLTRDGRLTGRLISAEAALPRVTPGFVSLHGGEPDRGLPSAPFVLDWRDGRATRETEVDARIAPREATLDREWPSDRAELYLFV
jgi:RNA polymerase sigma factor (sigma-70 family)